MSYTFKKYGCFTGPSVDIDYRDNDDFSLDPFEGYWNINDVSMALVRSIESPTDYVYLHLDGVSTNRVTLERNDGPIPEFNLYATLSNIYGNIYINGSVDVNGSVDALSVTCSGVKCFNIPHPTKNEKRLVHACLEGPENGVYVRGRLTNSNIIELPEYWSKLVDPESITVSLTQIGYSQDLIVEKIEWGKRVIIKSGTGANIDCYYTINATRVDLPSLEIEPNA